MTNRREFLHLGVAALSLPIAARALVSPEIFAPAERAGVEQIYEVFFDERFPACLAFGEAIKRRGLSTYAIRGDITDVWFSDLYYRWKQAPAAIAGLTAPGPLFCLEMLARDAGMRVAFRTDHRLTTSGSVSGSRIEHEFMGSQRAILEAADPDACGEHWPERMADLVSRFPQERDSAVNAKASGPVLNGGDDPPHLVTWVIAPVRCG
ncbi:MAG: hypothetical protein ACRD4R_03935 [Candidatus Acidiferrales bacterium]